MTDLILSIPIVLTAVIVALTVKIFAEKERTLKAMVLKMPASMPQHEDASAPLEFNNDEALFNACLVAIQNGSPSFEKERVELLLALCTAGNGNEYDEVGAIFAGENFAPEGHAVALQFGNLALAR